MANIVGRGKGGREVSLTITKLQEGAMWLRKAQDELTRVETVGEQEPEEQPFPLIGR